MSNPDHLTVALAQLTPVWTDRSGTLDKVTATIADAAARGAEVVAFPEAFVPGYPFWVERLDGARFDSPLQKKLFAHYVDQSVTIEAGHLASVTQAANQHSLTVVLGIIERPSDRGESLYASVVWINPQGVIESTHRKLMPTYDERLVWSPGDGHGLVTHSLGAFTGGALNCWENWLPLVRASLYAQGEDLHVAIWPGSRRNTEDITRFMAREARSYVLSVSALMSRDTIPDTFPAAAELRALPAEAYTDGGSCIAAPDGTWVVEPVVDREELIVAELDHGCVREERQNMDVAGHYSRPDVTQLRVDRRRQTTASFVDADNSSE